MKRMRTYLKVPMAYQEPRTSLNKLQGEREIQPPKPTKKRTDPVKRLVRQVVNPDTARWEARRTPQAMELVQQVAPKFYIGQAIGRLMKE